MCEITGFAAVSLQPNAGSQGEFAGLMVIRAYHRDRGDTHRDVVLIPASAHGTNPASAVMAGMKRRGGRQSPSEGNIDVADLKAKAEEHRENLAALMVTYPSTHGVFEESIQDICAIVHANGGQVYMDGANMNAQVGLTSPGADRRRCLPSQSAQDLQHSARRRRARHGSHRRRRSIWLRFCPGIRSSKPAARKAIHAVAAAPWSSASILLISYGYIKMLGREGMTDATRDRDPERQLHQVAAGAALSGAVHARKRPRRA